MLEVSTFIIGRIGWGIMLEVLTVIIGRIGWETCWKCPQLL